jgi:hypothetical protein
VGARKCFTLKKENARQVFKIDKKYSGAPEKSMRRKFSCGQAVYRQ